MSAAETYAAMQDAVKAQRLRIHGETSAVERFGEESARRFRADPHRELPANLEAIAPLIRPEDVVLDVGGGAGRMGLPLALRCREVINVDPSEAMIRQFRECAEEAGIHNVRAVHADWLDGEDLAADVVFSSHVTYFVRDIRRFLEKAVSCARRRVIIDVRSVANPNRGLRLFHLVYGEEQAPVPGHRELLAVMWEMGILPDVKVLRDPSWEEAVFASREEAIEDALQGSWCAPVDRERASQVLDAHFGDLFAVRDGGIRPVWSANSREMLITWETGQG